MKKNRHSKVKLAQIARESVRLADSDADLRELNEILEKKWLKGATNLDCTIRIYCDKGFMRDHQNCEELPSFLRRQMLNAFGRLSEYKAGSSFSVNKDTLILLEMETIANNFNEERVVASYFVLATEVGI